MRAQVCTDSRMITGSLRRSEIVDEMLGALFSSAMARKAELVSEPALGEFSFALTMLEILGLARSIQHGDGTRSWIVTDELEWLIGRDHVPF